MEPVVVLEHAEVDLDEVRGRARRAEREHRGRSRVGLNEGVTLLGDHCGELGDARRRLGDRERNAAARSSEARSAHGASRCRPRRGARSGERLCVDLVVPGSEVGQPSRGAPSPGRRPRRACPSRPSSRRPSRPAGGAGTGQRGQCSPPGVGVSEAISSRKPRTLEQARHACDSPSVRAVRLGEKESPPYFRHRRGGGVDPSCASAASRSAITSSRKRASASARATMWSRPGRTRGSSCAASTQPRGAAEAAGAVRPGALPDEVSSLLLTPFGRLPEAVLKAGGEAARDPARDRPRGSSSASAIVR